MSYLITFSHSVISQSLISLRWRWTLHLTRKINNKPAEWFINLWVFHRITVFNYKTSLAFGLWTFPKLRIFILLLDTRVDKHCRQVMLKGHNMILAWMIPLHRDCVDWFFQGHHRGLVKYNFKLILLVFIGSSCFSMLQLWLFGI